MKTMFKLNELSFELLSHPPYSPDLAPSTNWLFSDLKKMPQGKRFGSNEEVIAKTEAYFESKDESFYKKGIEKLRLREALTQRRALYLHFFEFFLEIFTRHS